MRGPPPWPDRRDFCNYFGIILAPFRDKIAATSDQMRFLGPENALKCVCGRGSARTPLGEFTALPQRCQPIYS